MYYLVFALLYTLSLLPFTALYLLADFFYVITYYVIRYRKEVVLHNVAMAFPEKTNDERKKIAKKFYRNFCDNWIETIKLISISSARLDKHISCNLAVFDKILASGRCCHVLLGHQFNWEWGNAVMPRKAPMKFLGVYSPISSKIMDRLFLYIRSRFGTVLLPYNDMRRAMLPHRYTQYILALMADQSPSNPKKSYWLNFLNTPTAFLQGPEKGARLGNIPVTYIAIHKIHRGYYHLEAKMLYDNPGTTQEGELTKRYAATLEESIRENPSGYLWSHKRWKYSWKEEYGKLWVADK
jgi:KDO2-lipid IV(A) lauroyltransferase